MSKLKLIVYSQELSRCSCFQEIFNTEFDTEPALTRKQFLNKIKSFKPDAAVVCFCSARKEDVEELLQLDAITGPLPVITCSKNFTLDFVSAAAQSGANRFLCCEWVRRKIEGTILEAVRHGGLKEFFETDYPKSFIVSPYVRKLVDEIVHAFPCRLHENELAHRLRISQRWLRNLCKQAFDRSFTQLMRRIWVYQALRLMQHTSLDNTEIALQLSYSEESSMARDFRKELGYSPNEARKRLAQTSPEELLCK